MALADRQEERASQGLQTTCAGHLLITYAWPADQSVGRSVGRPRIHIVCTIMLHVCRVSTVIIPAPVLPRRVVPCQRANSSKEFLSLVFPRSVREDSPICRGPSGRG